MSNNVGIRKARLALILAGVAFTVGFADYAKDWDWRGNVRTLNYCFDQNVPEEWRNWVEEAAKKWTDAKTGWQLMKLTRCDGTEHITIYMGTAMGQCAWASWKEAEKCGCGEFRNKGIIQFNSALSWSRTGKDTHDPVEVAMHEFGHMMRLLDNEKNEEDVMYWECRKGDHDAKLSSHDIKQARDAAKDKGVCTSTKPTSTNGGDPPIWGNVMVFPTPECSLGQDLNGDGDCNDTVLRYMNIDTGEVINTGAVVSGVARTISVYKDVIAFVGANRVISYYNINTRELTSLEVKGYHPSVYGDLLVFSEADRIYCYDLRSATFRDFVLEGSLPTIYENIVVFRYRETIWYHNLETRTTVDTGIIAYEPYLYGYVISFVMDETVLKKDLNRDGDELDRVIGVYDINSGALNLTGAVGRHPSIFKNIVVFTTEESFVGEDLNCDGKVGGSVIQYYDIDTGKLVNTRILGTEPSIYENIITYYVWETWFGYDLTGDGDTSDPVVGVLRINERVSMYKEDE